jgi:hypothetical protein
MIIVDLNQVMISNLFAQIGNHTNAVLEEDLVRHMVLNSIRSIKVKFKKYGEMIIACDDKNNWRKDFFPPYKGNRKKDREKSELNWSELFGVLNKIREELKEYFPYRVIQVDRAEADDVIASLVHKYGVLLNNEDTEQIMIVSGDKDFVQLQRYANVSQFDPVRKKAITNPDPQLFLKELVLKGDRGDGVPNVLSDDNSIISDERQKPLTAKKLQQLVLNDPYTFEGDLKRNYFRNSTLIDLDNVPQDIKDGVYREYDRQSSKTRDRLFNYFVTHRLNALIEEIGDF